MSATHPSRAAVMVQRRLLNRDSRTLVLQRLSQPMLARAFRWYRHPTGLAGGRRLLTRAPALDTLLARTLSSLGERGGEQADRVHGLCAFGAGLMTGVRLRDAIEIDSPFEGEADLEEALTRLEEWDGLATDEPCSPWLVASEAHAIAARLVRQEPTLDLLLHSAYRLVRSRVDGSFAVEFFQSIVNDDACSDQGEECPWSITSGYPGASSRFFFLLGLVAAGFHPPEVPDDPMNGSERHDRFRGASPDRNSGEGPGGFRPAEVE